MTTDRERQEVEAIELRDGRRLIVRHASGDDAAAVQALYRRLSVDDLDLRFFQAHVPPDQTTTRWVTIGERGGVALVVEVIDTDGTVLVVAEAGYSLLEDGDGELGITVDPDWRGWLGPWLLDLLIEQAASRGVANLQAAVLLRNQNMQALLKHRGYAAVDHPDWREVQLVISTTGRTPSWPEKGNRSRLLAVSGGARWAGESDAQDAQFEVRTCPGPTGATGGCPQLAGERCPLLDGADAVVVDLAPGPPEVAALIDVLEHEQIPIVYTPKTSHESCSPCERASDVLEQITEGLAEASAVLESPRPDPPIS